MMKILPLSEEKYSECIQRIKQYQEPKKNPKDTAKHELEMRFHFGNRVYMDKTTFVDLVQRLNRDPGFKRIGDKESYYEFAVNKPPQSRYRLQIHSEKAKDEYKNGISLSKISFDQTKDVFQIKSRYDSVQVHDVYFNLTLSSESEQEFSDVKIFKEQNSIRTSKLRFTFVDSQYEKEIRYDLTVTQNLETRDTYFDFEIEFVPDRIKTKALSKPEDILNKLLYAGYKLLQQIFQEPIVLTESKRRQVIKDCMTLVDAPKETFIGPQPVSMTHENLRSIFANDAQNATYMITSKTDGMRHLLFIDAQREPFRIDQRLNVRSLEHFVTQNIPRTLMDCEMQDGQIVVFDIYFSKGQQVTSEPLSTRLALIKEHVLNLPDQIKTKAFYPATPQGLEEIRKLQAIGSNATGGSSDGLIFTPIYEELPIKKGLGKTWSSLIKWKPEQDMTIDFILKRDYPIQDGYAYSLMCGEEKRPSSNLVSLLNSKPSYGLSRFKPNPGQYSPFTVEHLKHPEKNLDGKIFECAFRKGEWTIYRPRPDKENPNNIQTAISTWDQILHPITEEDLMKVAREAKAPAPSVSGYASDDDTVYYARDLFNEEYRGTLMLPLKIFHNKIIKGNLLIYKYKGEQVFDPACGQGGDLFKYLKAGAKLVVGVDYFAHNIYNDNEGALVRLASARLQPNQKCLFMVLDSSKPYLDQLKNQEMPPETVPSEDRELTQVIWNQKSGRVPANMMDYKGLVSNHRFDLISCQFALHYFFKDKESIENFCQNISYLLKSEGYFIGTSFDPQRVHDLLNHNPQPVGKKQNQIIWSLKRNYDPKRNPMRDVGLAINTYVGTIGKEITEYLVAFDYLKELLDKYNIKLIEKRSFQDVYEQMNPASATNSTERKIIEESQKMSDDERQLSFLYMYFVFSRK